MAQQDLAGLLTGITQAPIDPMAGASIAQRQLAMGAQAAQGLRQGMGGLFNTDTRTTKEKADQMMAKLDYTKKADRDQMLKIVGNVNPQAAPVLRARFAQMDADMLAKQKRRESLITQAGKLGLENTVELLRNNGDMTEAAKQIRKIEESDTLASKGIKGKLAIARQYNAPESILKDIQNGTYNQTTPEELLKVIRGDKADLKAFLNEEGETVYGRVNEFSAKVYDEETDKWATPSELGYTPAPVVTKQISAADSVVKQLTAGATKSFLEVNKAAQVALDVLKTTDVSRELLESGARSGFGTEWANKSLSILNSTGLLPEKYMDGVAASKALVASRSKAVLKMIPIFGGGQGFTEQDRLFLVGIAAADASFDTQTIARLLDLEERAAREAISLNNSSLDQVMKLASVNGESYPELQNVFYITPPAQREVAPVGSNSTLSPATEAYLREQELIDE
jgi:hypothetical protein